MLEILELYYLGKKDKRYIHLAEIINHQMSLKEKESLKEEVKSISKLLIMI
jgi:hypothetical protein